MLPECWDWYSIVRNPGRRELFNYTTPQEIPAIWCKDIENGTANLVHKQMSGRDFLQKLGTDAVRNGLHDMAWVNALMSEYKPKDAPYKHLADALEDKHHGLLNYPNWILTDTRFPNELSAVKKAGGITIKITREFYSLEDGKHCWFDREDRKGWVSVCSATNYTKEESYKLYQDALNRESHSSETSLDTAEFDYTIENNGTIEELTEKLQTILKQTKII